MPPIKNNIQHFNIRVYGLWINSRNEILTTVEKIRNSLFIKFPGGGLEFGEGILDCLKREWKEELGREYISAEHYYTSDFFQQSLFNPYHQVISIYYLVTDDENLPLIPPKNDQLVTEFRWLPIKAGLVENITLPIDKVAAKKILDKSSKII